MKQDTTKPQGIATPRLAQRLHWSRVRMRNLVLRLFVGLVAVLAPAAVVAQQMCTPGNIAANATAIQLFNAAGDFQGAPNPDLSVGDIVVYRNAIIADYNAAATVDVVYEILDIVTGPGGSARLNTGSGEIELSAIAPVEDSYMTYRILVFVGGTLTNTVASGEPATLMNAVVSLQDIDSNSNQNFTDVGGFLVSGPSVPTTITLSNTTELPFQNANGNGGGPANFRNFLATPNPAGQNPLNFTDVPNTQNFPLFSASFGYSAFDQGTFVHGVTGQSPNNLGGRGAAIAMCGEILAPDIAVTKSTVSQTENPDGTTDVTYQVNIENTGFQDLDNLSITDALDSIFSTPIDIFVPSTTATTTGGVIALDATATVVTDLGPTLDPIATNPDFDGGGNIEILLQVDPNTQPQTPTLSPGDEISVQFTIRLFPNDGAQDLVFVNSADISVLDDFNVPLQAAAPAPGVTIPTNISEIELIKAVTSVEDTNTNGTVGDAGDTVNYSYVVTNTGDVTLFDVIVIETLFTGTGTPPVPGNETITANPSGLSADSAADASVDTLGVGDSATFTASYVLTQDDVNTGEVTNQAQASAENVAGTPVTASSDNDANQGGVDGAADADGNNATVLNIPGNAELMLVKTAVANFSAPPIAGDIIDFTFEVTNTGNVTVFDIDVTEVDFSGAGAPLVPVFAAGGSDENGLGATDLLPGASLTFTASYALVADDLIAGQLSNSALASGTDPDNAPVTDVSDTGTDRNGAAVPDAENTETPEADGVSVDNIADNDPTVLDILSPPVAVDDSVENVTPGDAAVLVDIVSANDTDADGTPQIDRVSLVPPAGATTLADLDGDIISVTVPGEGTWTYDDVSGAATFTPEPGFEGDPTPITYTVLDDDGLISNEATLSVDYNQQPAISVEKSADISGVQTPAQAGDEIVYTYVVRNDGNVTLFDVSVIEQTTTFSGTGILPAPVFVSGGGDLDGDGDANDLAPGTDTITFSASYALTAADIDAGTVTNQAQAVGDNVTGIPVTDLSDDPANPDDVQDNANPADPTVVTLGQLAEIALIKVVLNVPDTNGDGLFGGEGDIIPYAFTVTNTGNVTLDNVTVDDPLFVVTGGPISLVAGQTDAITFRGELTVGPDDIALGFIQNTATASAEPVNGGVISDVSDTGTDPGVAPIANPETVESIDGFGNEDQDPTNDPTVVTVPAGPLPGIALTKSILAVTDTNANGITDAGDTIDYVFAVTNTGNVRLSEITITDPLVTVVGTIATLEVAETNNTDLTGTYVIEAGDVATGFVENTAQVTSLAINTAGDPILDPGTGVQLSAADTSDSGTQQDLDAGGNPVSVINPEVNETLDGAGLTDNDPTNDPTVLRIPQPQIELIKSVVDVADTNNDGLTGGVNDVITFAFTVTNTGTVDLVNITVDDALVAVVGGPIASLAIGQSDSNTFSATYVVTAADIAAGFVQNTATATGAAVDENGNPFFGPGGDPVEVTDISDTGTAANGATIANPGGNETIDGNGGSDADPTNDPTVITVPANPLASIILVKSALGAADTNGDAVSGGFGDLLTYSFAVTNTSNLPLSNVVVTDPVLGGSIGTIPVLAVGETVTLTFDYEITFDDFTAGVIENTATATGTLTNLAGDPIIDGNTGAPITATDISDTGTNPDLSVVPDPEGTETPDADNNINNNTTDDPTVTQIPTIPSGAAVSGVFFLDNNQNDAFDVGIDQLTAGIIVNLINGDGQIVGTALTDANGFYEISGFPVGANFSISFIDPANGNVLDSITGLSFGPNTVLDNQDGLTFAAGASNLVMTKTTTRDTVILGESVPYTITLSNTGSAPVPAVDVVDTLPVGLGFIQGTATVNGAPVIPTQQGRTITFPGVFVPAGGSVDITLFATVLPNAPFGDLTNTVVAVDPVTGTLLAQAAVTIERLPEAIFDCSDVIGKVFDDRNFNGYQDPAPTQSQRRSDVSNQSIFNGKLGVAADTRQLSQGEPGLAGIRLLTATGTQITTDEYGRYSVPCAELAGPIGTNFTLKLDPLSLPTGYRVTTENPRTMRLTAGIATELNFGAALGRVLDVDLTAAAFSKNTPVERLDQGLTKLLRQVADTPSIVRISYFSSGEDTRTAQARIKAVEDIIEKRWRGIGRYRLIVETTIKRLQ